MKKFGDKLYDTIRPIKSNIYRQGQFFQLTIQALDEYSNKIDSVEEKEIPLTFPIGFKDDNEPFYATINHKKEDLKNEYHFLSKTQLPLNGIYQLVTIMENLFVDILREVFTEFPNKVSSGKKIEYSSILNSDSIEDLKVQILNSVINDFTYKSPKDFSIDFKKYVGVDFEKNDNYIKYIELKATRDIHIHNQGIINELYISKVSEQARGKIGDNLKVDINYFLKSYENCLQIIAFLEEELNKIWNSPIYNQIKKIMKNEGILDGEKTKRISKILKEFDKNK